MKKILLVPFIFITIFGFSNERPTVTVNVFGEFRGNDNSVIFIEIDEEATTSNDASRSANEKEKAVEAAILAVGITEENFSTVDNFASSSDEMFSVRKSIEVRIPEDINIDTGLFYEAVIGAGASGYSDYRNHKDLYGSKDDNASPATIEEAVIAAEAKARKLAKAFNGSIGNIIAIKEMSYGPSSNEVLSFEVTYELIY